MRILLRGACAASFVGASLIACNSAEAGLDYVSQQREVQAVNGIATSREGFDPDNPTGAIENERISAPDFGPFDATASVEFRDPSDTDAANALASQTSTLDDDGFSASGMFDVFGDDRGFSRSIFRLAFDLTTDVDYDLSLGAEYTALDESSFTDERQRILFRFARVADDGSETVVAENTVTAGALSEDPTFDLSQDGQLEAGRYTLDFEIRAHNPQGRDETGTYELAFSTTDIDDGTGSPGDGDGDGDGGGEPNPIPLPPAAWAGLLTFAGYGATRALGKRLRRA